MKRQMSKSELLLETERYIHIPQGFIGRLEKDSGENKLSLYVSDIADGTIICFVNSQRISLLCLDFALTKDDILREMTWVTHEGDCKKIILQSRRYEQNFYPKSFVDLGEAHTSQFTCYPLDDRVCALSITFHGKDNYKILAKEASSVERHPLETALVRLHKRNNGMINAGRKPDIQVASLIFTGNDWQKDYDLGGLDLLPQSQAFLELAKKDKEKKVDPSNESTISKNLSVNFFKPNDDKKSTSPFPSTKKVSDTFLKSSPRFDAPRQLSAALLNPNMLRKPISLLSFLSSKKEPSSKLDEATELINKDTSEAINIFKEILSKQNENQQDYILALYNIGLCYRLSDNVGEASAPLDRAIEILESDLQIEGITGDKKSQLLSECYLEKGRVLVLLNSLDEGESFFKKAVKVFINNFSAYNSLGLLKERKHSYVEAYECYENAITINPEYSIGYNNLGLLLSKLAMHENALEILDKAVEYAPNIANNYVNRGSVKQKLNLLKEAEKDFEEAIKLEPDFIPAHAGLAFNDLLQGYPLKAISTYKILLSRNPNDVDMLRNLSSCYVINEDYINAALYAKRLLAIMPDDLSGWMNLGAAYQLSNKLEDALDAFENIMQFSKGHEHDKKLFLNHYHFLAQILTRFKYFEEAINTYECALLYCELDKEKANIYFKLGNLHFDNKNYVKAEEYYKKSHTIQEDDVIGAYLQEASEMIARPDASIPTSHTLHNRTAPLCVQPEERENLEKCLNSNIPVTEKGTVRFDNGFPLHSLRIPDEVKASRHPSLFKLFLENGVWKKVRCANRYAKDGRPQPIPEGGGKAYNFVIKQKTPDEPDEIEIIFGNVGHFYLSNRGKEVIFAGEIWFKDRKIEGWNNGSGHFRPNHKLAPRISALSKLPLDKFIPLDQLRGKLLAAYLKYGNNPKKMAEILPEKLKDAAVIKSLCHHYIYTGQKLGIKHCELKLN